MFLCRRSCRRGGDTTWHGSWWEIGRQYGPFDAVFLPINGFRFLGRDPDVDVPSSLTPEQAAAAARVEGRDGGNWVITHDIFNVVPQ